MGIQVIEPLTLGEPSEALRAKFNYAADAQHYADVRHEQDGAGREGWASTDPGRTKYHHYGPDGQSKCSYQKKHGPLHFADNSAQLTPAECCTACDLHLLKAKHAQVVDRTPYQDCSCGCGAPSRPASGQTALAAPARQSAWQKKQYPSTQATQLTLF